MSATSDQAGFSLVELLVALTIFGLAAVALLRLQTSMLAGTLALEDRQWAEIVAHNQAVAARLAGSCGSGEEAAGGRSWRWQCRRSPGPAGMALLAIEVRGDDGRPLASVTQLVPA